MDNYDNIDYQKNKCYKLVSKLTPTSQYYILKALKFAEKKHKGQNRISANLTPYVIHIYRVVLILLEEFKISDPEVLSAAALHDVIEDSGVTANELSIKFGKNIATMVKEESQNLFPSRKTYMEHFKRASTKVKFIKISDRIDNLRTISHKTRFSDEKRAQYVIESEKYILPISKQASNVAQKKLQYLIKNLKANKKLSLLYKKLKARDKIGYQDTEK